ncbi:class D sortase [Cytobacillus sp. S13-E01]|uniref:class D sortase n=1 Tax=Cytobacillus sp. S13-E01 TaxID=3031326 RepID=UPI0023D84B3C|nr:class D sortase [Cytobacillus sp. S13-E01]MDF0725464.1 class D sortase [Cytobacillus sp. S13-E01]
MKKLSIILIGCGIVFFSWNFYSFWIGYTASSWEDARSLTSTKDLSKITPKKMNTELYSDIPEMGEKIGTLTIPRLKQSFPIYQGTSKGILKKGIGHYAKSVLPGEENNSILSGHRDTVFRGLKDLKQRDQLIVTTDAGEFLYKIKKIRIVEADDKTVLTPKPRGTLTVTTCYPFYFLGDAPQRYIIVADLINP